jgi:hypothetical protein
MPFQLVWEGIAVCISHTKNWLQDEFDHIEVTADQPIPITETGYKSHFIQQTELALFEGPEDFVRKWIEAEAIKPDWIRHVAEMKRIEEDSRQLTLF